VKDGPAQYIVALCAGQNPQSATLLRDMLGRSWQIADSSPFKRAALKVAFCNLREARDVDRLFRDSLDLCTNRLDAWITSLATKRLWAMRKTPTGWATGIHLGAFGFVENLKPRGGNPTSAGYIHAPSRNQAAAAAVVHNAYLTHASGVAANPFRINLS